MSSSNHPFYLDSSGTPRELGLAHGEHFRPVIHKAIEQWQNDMSEFTKMPFENLMGLFLEATDYRPAIMRWTPHVYAEMQAIGEAANVADDVIYTWQMVDEFIDFIVEYVYVEKCTTVGGYDQADDAPPTIGKTQDLMHCYIGAGALVRTRYADSDIDILNSTIAGITCQDGMSRHLAVCLNHIGQLARSPQGLPVSFIARMLMERSRNIEDAAMILGEVTHASGMNYGLADAQSVRTFEVSADHVEEYLPVPELRRIWHTNHPVANDNYCRDIGMWNKLPDAEAGNTQARFDFIEREASKAEEPLTRARIMQLLSSREAPVSAHAEDDFPTINSVVMEFGETPTMFFSPGPPSQVEYVPFTFD